MGNAKKTGEVGGGGLQKRKKEDDRIFWIDRAGKRGKKKKNPTLKTRREKKQSGTLRSKNAKRKMTTQREQMGKRGVGTNGEALIRACRAKRGGRAEGGSFV